MLVFQSADGVLCAHKNVFAPKHHELEVPNLHVLKLMQSFVSKGLVTECFNWQWFYWTLTDKGIEYLRAYMSLPADIVPNSLKKPATTFAPRRQESSEEGARGSFRGGRGRGGSRGGRGGYRGPREGGEVKLIAYST
jgi:small subunit ribosomal protein S10e